MTNQVAIQLVNLRALKIVKLLTSKAEDLDTNDHADMDAFAVQYIPVHDRHPIEWGPAGKRVRSLAGESETNRALGPISPSPLARALQAGGWLPDGRASHLASGASRRAALPCLAERGLQPNRR
jgi:hypothetical protein